MLKAVACPHADCGWHWLTQSQSVRTTCPNCGRSVALQKQARKAQITRLAALSANVSVKATEEQNERLEKRLQS